MPQPRAQFPTDVLGRLVGFLFLALIPLVTLIPDTPRISWLTQDLVLRLVTAILFLFCILVYFRKPQSIVNIELDLPNLTVLLLSAWVLLSVKNSKEAFESFYAFRSFLALVLAWFSLRIIWNRWPELYPLFERVFFWTSVVAAAWLCISTIGHKTESPVFAGLIPRIGFFVNENVAAGFLGMSFLWALFKRLHRRSMPFWALGLFFLAWALTQSRGAFVAMIAVIVLYLFFHMREVEKRLSLWEVRQWLLFAAMVIVFFACTSFTIYKLFNDLEVDPRASNRWDLWTSGFKMAMDQPLLGFGPGTFQDVYPAYRPASIWNTFVVAAHDEYLQVVLECGWPALLFVFLFLWVILRRMGGNLFRITAFKEAPGDYEISECVFFIVLFEAIHNLVDFTFHEWCHRLVLLAFAAFALRNNKTQDDIQASFRFSRRAFLAGMLVFSMFVLWTLGVGSLRDYLARLYDFNSSMAYQQNNLELAETFGMKSLALRPDFMKPWNLLGAVEDVRGERETIPSEKKKHFQLAEEYYEKATRLSPYSLEPMENRVRFMMVQRRFSEALELQKQMLERAPGNPIVFIHQAEILLVMGRAQEAITSAQKAIDLDDHFVPSYLAKAQAMEALGKKNDAIQVYKTVEEIVEKQNDPELLERLKDIKLHIQKLKSQK